MAEPALRTDASSYEQKCFWYLLNYVEIPYIHHGF